MSVVRGKMIPEFYFGDDAVLLAADREGIDAFERALSDAAGKKELPADLSFEGIRHEFDVRESETRVELHENSVIWRLPDQKVSEILDKPAGCVTSFTPLCRHR